MVDGEVDDQVDCGVGQQLVERGVNPPAILGDKRLGPFGEDIGRTQELHLGIGPHRLGVRARNVTAAGNGHTQRR